MRPALFVCATPARNIHAKCRRESLSPARCGTSPPARLFSMKGTKEGRIMGKGILLWLIGVPIPIILLLWLFFH